ncbi:MAG: hypothetical protein VX946_08200, partial [Pseudomonadota bacterium]|nr:hypothetical protein [Pseudomonadota bacterium]
DVRRAWKPLRFVRKAFTLVSFLREPVDGDQANLIRNNRSMKGTSAWLVPIAPPMLYDGAPRQDAAPFHASLRLPEG